MDRVKYMGNRQIEQEIIKKYVVNNKQERILWELQSPKKRDTIFWKFAGVNIFKQECLHPIGFMSKSELECELLRMGKREDVYYIGSSYIGEVSLKQAVEKVFFCEICIIYCGNGVGYYQGEQEVGGPPRFLLK